MKYNTPELTLVGAAQGLVLGAGNVNDNASDSLPTSGTCIFDLSRANDERCAS